MKKVLFLSILISFFFFFVHHSYASGWTVTAVQNGLVDGTFGSCGSAYIYDSYGNLIRSTGDCSGSTINFGFVPDGTLTIKVNGAYSEYFTVSNGILVNNAASQLSKKVPTTPFLPNFNVYAGYPYNTGYTLISTLGSNFCNNIGWDIYNIDTNEIVSHVVSCGGNGEILNTEPSLSDGTYYVFGYPYVGIFNNTVTYFEFYSNAFRIINGQFYPTYPPVITSITAPSDPVLLGTTINTSAYFTDSDTSDTHTAIWDWGDGTTSVGVVNESLGSGTFSGSHIYTSAGVYTITAVVQDNTGFRDISTFQYVSAYDPTPQSLFTGARIFTSQTGSYISNPNLSGQVQFGVLARYSGAQATANVSMSFKLANLDFKSNTTNLLVTANGKATLRGTGTINGAGNYSYLITGLDSLQNGGQGTIRFQIKDQLGNLIYDTQPGATDTANPTTSVTGQVIVH